MENALRDLDPLQGIRCVLTESAQQARVSALGKAGGWRRPIAFSATVPTFSRLSAKSPIKFARIAMAAVTMHLKGLATQTLQMKARNTMCRETIGCSLGPSEATFF
jgi:hypothetical protein